MENTMFRPTHDKIRAAYREGEEAKNGCQALDAAAGCVYRGYVHFIR